ncbi:MAG: carboxypeptidase regulatory-like domain-containing protein [Bradymonadaceae bacterium]|nr:carboxypeptidase regulatory-like domain-containing protein [Lujinxingiaceae bacterium]
MRKILYIALALVCLVLATIGATLWVVRTSSAPAPVGGGEPPKAWQTFTFLDEPKPKSAAREPDHIEDPAHAQARVDARVSDQPARWVRLIDQHRHGVEGTILVGAPGLWPFETIGADPDGLAVLPELDVTTMARQPVHRYELLARSEDREKPMGFWGEHDAPVAEAFGAGMVADAELTMVAAADVRFRVEDPDGNPVGGTFVRMARASVGLLHLTTTTAEDGLVTFTRLPPGQYTATFNAEGHSRTTVNITHTLGAEQTIVTLGQGRAFRMPESWRGPPGDAPTPRSPGDDSEEQSDDSEAPTEQAEAQAVPKLRVFVVDAYGGPVDGALVELWSATTRVAHGHSRGSRPLELSAGASAGKLVAIHPGWGEGELASSAPEDGELIIRLDKPLFYSRLLPGRVTDIQEIEIVLDADLVEDNASWLIDATDPDSAAMRAGIQRGDSLMSLRRVGQKHEAIVSRRGKTERFSF